MRLLSLEEAWKGRDLCTVGVCVRRQMPHAQHNYKIAVLDGYTGQYCPGNQEGRRNVMSLGEHKILYSQFFRL
jgi:hypothetical protein